jgi:agmatine/peptidylarginine deiminase
MFCPKQIFRQNSLFSPVLPKFTTFAANFSIFKTMKKVLSIFTLMFLMAVTVQAQEKKPDWMRWHYLSEEEMHDKSRGMNFVETDPPTGEPRFVAEFEPMQGVMIRYPLGIPTSLVVQLADNCQVYCIVSSSYQSQAQNSFQSAGVNMDRVTFVNAQSDSYWVRDYGPWYIFEDRNPAIVDNIYNRPRPNDDNMSGVFANFWGIPMYGMRLEHTGGNMMEDGRGHGVSDDLVFQENWQDYGIDEATVRQKMSDYLGIDPYHVTIDPQGDYIAHVDCWGKYLAPDKILIARLPESNPRYPYYEQVAEYFESINCCWGYPYHVYRVDEPGGYTLAPYTNSLILNKTVYVPLGTNNTYNNDALAVYQEAMPGYEIIGVPSSGYSGWENTDALHCRTRGVMDFNMLFVDHRDVLFGEQAWQDSIPVVSKFIAYSGEPLKTDSLLVYYSIDGGTYQVAHMTATGNPDEYVGYIKGYQGESSINYYVYGADESGHRYTQPVFAGLDPHHFTMEAHEPAGELIITPDTLWFNQMGEVQDFVIRNETADAVTIEDITPVAGSALNIWEPNLPLTLQTGQSVTVVVGLQYAPLKNEYLAYDIRVTTSLGERTVVAMVLDEAYDMGLYIPGAPTVELTINEPQAMPYAVNGNYGTHTPIDITAVYEKGEISYLELNHHDLPYTLEAGQYFEITMRPAAFVGKSQVFTEVILESSDATLTWSVSIEDELLNVTELSAEAKLYPNPTTGQFTVEGANVAKVEVFNLVGQKVYEQQGSKVVNIDAADWNKGIYLVNIIDRDGAVVTKKLVVK